MKNYNTTKVRQLLLDLINIYGNNITLASLLEQFNNLSSNKCPECNGKGEVDILIPVNETFEETSRYKNKTVRCISCDGKGYITQDHAVVKELIKDGLIFNIVYVNGKEQYRFISGQSSTKVTLGNSL